MVAPSPSPVPAPAAARAAAALGGAAQMAASQAAAANWSGGSSGVEGGSKLMSNHEAIWGAAGVGPSAQEGDAGKACDQPVGRETHAVQ